MIKKARTVVKQPVEIVWRIITSSEKYHGLKLPGIYSSYQKLPLSKGVAFKYQGLAFNNEYELFIVDSEENHIFSFGHDPNNWKIKFELESGGESTIVSFYREFNDYSFIEKLKIFFGGDDDQQTLTDATALALSNACNNLLSSSEDGIFVHEWKYE